MTGDELTIIQPARAGLAGADTVTRLAEVHTNATTDAELVSVWLKARAANSDLTRRLYDRIGHRFVAELAHRELTLRTAKLDDVQDALETLATTEDGAEAKPATLNTYVAAVKSLLSFAHAVGFTRFNAAPLIRLNATPRKLAERIMTEGDVAIFIRSARTDRDRLMFRVAYYGGLRVSELVALTWSQIIPRDSGEAQIAVVGKGGKERNVLVPADVAAELVAMRSGASADDRVFKITDRRFNAIVKATAKRAGLDTAVSAHWFRHAHASHALDGGAPISLVSQGLGHASIRTTSVYSHARPGDSASRFLKKV